MPRPHRSAARDRRRTRTTDSSREHTRDRTAAASPGRLLRRSDDWIRRAPAPRRDDVLLHGALGLAVVLLVLPILIAAIASTKQAGSLYTVGDLAVGGHAVENYRTALFEYGFGRFVINSAVMSVTIVAGTVALSVPAALAIVYYRLPHGDLGFLFVLFTLLFPVPVRFVPLYELVTDLGWADMIFAITVPYLASATTVFILRQHFLSIPSSLVETSKLDGVGPIRFLRSVLLPMSADVLVGASVITFVYAWNQYLWPLIIIDTERKHVAQVGLSMLGGDHVTMAGAVLSLLPSLLVLVLFRRQLLATVSTVRR